METHFDNPGKRSGQCLKSWILWTSCEIMRFLYDFEVNAGRYLDRDPQFDTVARFDASLFTFPSCMIATSSSKFTAKESSSNKL